jgi:hypothetical protein
LAIDLNDLHAAAMPALNIFAFTSLFSKPTSMIKSFAQNLAQQLFAFECSGYGHALQVGVLAP